MYLKNMFFTATRVELARLGEQWGLGVAENHSGRQPSSRPSPSFSSDSRHAYMIKSYILAQLKLGRVGRSTSAVVTSFALYLVIISINYFSW